MTLNPLRAYFEYRFRQNEAARLVQEAERLERREERDLFRTSLESIVAMAKAQADTNRAQSEAFQTFLSGFTVTDPPRTRQFDEVSDMNRWLESHGYGVPHELRDKSTIDQYHTLLDRMEKFELGE